MFFDTTSVSNPMKKIIKPISLDHKLSVFLATTCLFIISIRPAVFGIHPPAVLLL